MKPQTIKAHREPILQIDDWSFVVIKAHRTIKVPLPDWMIDMMLQDRECILAFLEPNYWIDTEFDETSSEYITGQIENLEDQSFFLNPMTANYVKHNIDGVGHSKWDVFRINCVLANSLL